MTQTTSTAESPDTLYAIQMIRITLIFFLTFCFTYSANSQKLDHYLSDIFFKTNISQADTSIISLLKVNPELNYQQTKGRTVYPHLIKPNDTPAIHLFKFDSNPFFKPRFSTGTIIVEMTKNKNGEFLTSIGLGLTTTNVTAGDSMFNVLDKRFTKYSSKKSIRKGLDDYHEVINYYNKDKTIRVELSKSISNISFSKAKEVGVVIIVYYFDSE